MKTRASILFYTTSDGASRRHQVGEGTCDVLGIAHTYRHTYMGTAWHGMARHGNCLHPACLSCLI